MSKEAPKVYQFLILGNMSIRTPTEFFHSELFLGRGLINLKSLEDAYSDTLGKSTLTKNTLRPIQFGKYTLPFFLLNWTILKVNI